MAQGKEHQRTDKMARQIQLLSGFGLTLGEIGRVVDLSAPTLRKYYLTELDTGHLLANAKVAESLFRMATHSTKPNVAAAIFWAKTRMRWREDGGDDLGKKEAAELLGRVADKDTKWDGLLS